jgi:UDP-GlcNAc:undecaprenyl-phosphate GlcNAc-1-phosphate transferase
VFAAGIRIEAVAGNQLPLWLSLPVTVFWLLLCTNALNLIDGLDGLCAGMGMLATLTLCGAALLQDNLPLAFATFPLTGALLGFLVYNFNPATVFLGDSGALLIGFLLGCYGMSWTQKTATLLSMIVPLLALSIPLLDVSLSVFRRMLRNRPIFSADRGHIHHRLLDRGLSPRRAVLVLYLVASLAAALALLLSLPRLGKWHGLIVLAFCLAVFWGVRKLRYAEFDMVSRLLFGGEFQRAVNTKLKAETVAAALEKTQSEEQWWAAVSQFAREAGLLRAVWMSSRGLREWQSQNAGSAAWSLTVAVGDNETLQLDGPDPLSEPLDLIAILSALRQSHAAKASGWSELTKAGESHG